VLDGGVDPTLALEVARLRDEVRALGQGNALGLDPDGGRAMVADVMRELRAEEQRKRDEARARGQAAQAEKLSAFLDGAGLSVDQRSLMVERLKAEADARQAVFDSRSADAVKDWMAAQRQTDKAARATLSGAQYEQFVSLRRPGRGDR